MGKLCQIPAELGMLRVDVFQSTFQGVMKGWPLGSLHLQCREVSPLRFIFGTDTPSKGSRNEPPILTDPRATSYFQRFTALRQTAPKLLYLRGASSEDAEHFKRRSR